MHIRQQAFVVIKVINSFQNIESNIEDYISLLKQVSRILKQLEELKKVD